MDGGLQGMKQLLSQNRNITAVICANDMTAIGALRACKELGVQVPDEISIIGINDNSKRSLCPAQNKQHTRPFG